MNKLLYCFLKSNIVDFYLGELRHAKIQPYTRDNEVEAIRSNILKAVRNILKFVAAILLGESRHFNKFFQAKRFANKWFNFCPNKYTPNEHHRRFIYSQKIPEFLFQELFIDTYKLFSREGWGKGYGGHSWSVISKYAKDLDELVNPYYGTILKKCFFTLGDAINWGDIIIKTDMIISSCHNSGKALDKYDCTLAKSLLYILDYKRSEGIRDFSIYFDGNKPCYHMPYCSHTIFNLEPKFSNGLMKKYKKYINIKERK